MADQRDGLALNSTLNSLDVIFDDGRRIFDDGRRMEYRTDGLPLH